MTTPHRTAEYRSTPFFYIPTKTKILTTATNKQTNKQTTNKQTNETTIKEQTNNMSDENDDDKRRQKKSLLMNDVNQDIPIFLRSKYYLKK